MRFYNAMPDKNTAIDKVFKWIVDIVVVAMLAVFLMNYIGLRTKVVGNSMAKELVNNDEVFIDTLIYRLKKPSRFDVISFTKQGVDGVSMEYIKRIIGLPGETVEIKDGRIYIDNKLLDYNKDMEDIVNPGLAASPITLSYNEYFVIGDNWNSSEDSRSGTVENVKTEEITGKVWLVVSPFVRIGLVN